MLLSISIIMGSNAKLRKRWILLYQQQRAARALALFGRSKLEHSQDKLSLARHSMETLQYHWQRNEFPLYCWVHCAASVPLVDAMLNDVEAAQSMGT